MLKEKLEVKRILLFFLVFTFSFKLSYAAVDVPKLNTAKEQVGYAYKLKGQKKYEQAVLAFEKVAEYFPEDREWCVTAQIEIGQTLRYNIEDYYKAIDAFSKILREYPEQREDCARAIDEIAQIYNFNLENDEMAVEILKKGIRDYYDQTQYCARAHNFIGMIYWEAGEYEKAIKEYQKTIDSFSNCKEEVIDALQRLGSIYKDPYNIESDYEEAIAPLRKIADDFSIPKDKRAYALVLMGDAYKGKCKYKEAIEIFKRIKEEFKKEGYQVSQAKNEIKECEKLNRVSTEPKIWKTYTNTSYINKIYVGENKIWVGTRGGIRIIDKETLQSKMLNTSNGLLNNDVISLVGDEDCILASSSWGGISKIDKRTWEISCFPTYNLACMGEMVRIGSTIWMGQRNGGLHKCNISTNKSKWIQKNWGSISDIVVGDNVLWISSTYGGEGSCGEGIQAYDFTKDKIIKVLKVEDGLPQNENEALYIDKNILWIGSAQQGLSRYDIRNDSLQSIAETENWSILSLDGNKENLWVGTNHALYKLNKKTGQIEKIPATEKMKITTIAVDEDILWVGTNDGIYKYKPRTNELTLVKLTGEISGNNIQTITKQNGSIRVVTEGGISIYDSVTDSWISYTKKEQKTPFKKQKYWNKNLTTIGLDGEIEICFPSPANAKSIFISCVVEDDLYQWVGTYIWGEGEMGTGLLRIDKKTREIKKCYSTFDGLAGNLITYIFTDKEHVWVGTTQGVSRVNKEKLSK